MMKSDPVITYNHMEEDTNRSKTGYIRETNANKLIYIAEFAVIAALVALMFFVF